MDVEANLKSALLRERIIREIERAGADVQPTAVDDLVSKAIDKHVVVLDTDDPALPLKYVGAWPNLSAWIDLERDHSPHLFGATSKEEAPDSGDKKFGGFSKADFDKLDPIDKLRIANGEWGHQ